MSERYSGSSACGTGRRRRSGWWNGRGAASDGTAATRARVKVRGRLSGGLGGLRAEFTDEVGGALRVRGGGEHGAVIVLQNFQPILNIGGVVLARFERQFEVGAQERGAQFRHEFFLGVGVGAETVPAEITVKAVFRA